MIKILNRLLERFNLHKPSLRIVKIDRLTRQPMESVQFEIKIKDGKILGTFKTNEAGEIYLEDIEPGRYVITELPLDGYLPLTESREIVIELGLNVVEFQNQPQNPIVIRKVNSVTGEPLADAIFSVSRVDGTFIGEFKTGRNGYAVVSGSHVTPGHYLIREIKSSPGFILDETPKIVELRFDSVAEVEFENRPLNGIQIRKVDENGEPLPDVWFVVREKGGSVVGEFRTSSTGLIDVPDLEPGWYQIFESKGLDTHLMDGRVVDVELKWNDHVLLEFVNTKLSGLQVIKRDEFTKEPIQGVSYKLTKLDGTLIGHYKTGPGGDFVVDGLEPSYYTLTEESTVPGYILDPVPYTFEIKKGQKAIVIERTNKPLAGLQLRKVDSVTGLPLAGVEFLVTELDGTRVGSFTTPESGIIFIPNLKPQYYVVQEVKGLPTHKPDTAPRNILVESGKLNVCEYRNNPYPVFEFQKIDGETKAPLEGVRFRLLDRNSREIGIFKTNVQGKITLTGMDEGRYFWQEVEAKESYALDRTVYEISLQWGEITTLELKNTPLGSLRVKKIDKITQLPMSGVWFLLRDSKMNIIGEYKTGSAGMIELPKSLEAGKYFLEEKSTLPNYVLSKELFEVEIKPGATAELVIENQPYRGKIQIEKLASADHPYTRQKKDQGLEGAVFEIINDKKEVVDRIESDERGIATSIELPVGRYGIREITSPQHWLLDDKLWYCEIKLHDELLQFQVYNDPADISVLVEKRGNLEAMPGDEIRYDFYVENTSNTALENFYWHDLIPYDGARVTQVNTGTWSEQLTYKVMYRTNLKRTYRVLEDKLSTKTDNVLECGREALGLAANEYVTDIRFEFGEVGAGFQSVDTPYMYMTVLANLPSGYQFTNRTTVGGELDGEWITSKDAWTTCVWKPVGPLPRTGY